MDKKNRIIISVIFILAVVLRLAAYFVLRRHENPMFWEYHEIANNFLAGRGLCCNFLGITHYAYLEPFYPLFSAFWYGITGHNYLVFGIANILASAASTVAVFALAKDLFDEKVGLLAAFITAAHPGLIYYSTQFHPLTFDVIFFTMIIASLVKLSKTAAAGDAFVTGACVGLAFLSRTTAIMFIPLCVAAILFMNVPARRKIALSVVVALIALTAVTAWTARNYAVLHKIVITRSTPGWLFWLGNNPNHTGSAMYDKGKSMMTMVSDADFAELKKRNELGQNAFFTERAVSFIRGDPTAFLARWAKRIYYYWWFTPQAGFLYPSAWLAIYMAFYLLLLVPAMLAVALISMFHKRLTGVYLFGIVVTIIFCVALSVAQSAFYVEGRHRWTVEPIMGIFSAWFYLYLFQRLRDRNILFHPRQ